MVKCCLKKFPERPLTSFKKLCFSMKYSNIFTTTITIGWLISILFTVNHQTRHFTMSKTEIDYCLQDPKSLKVLHRFDFAIHQLMFPKIQRFSLCALSLTTKSYSNHGLFMSPLSIYGSWVNRKPDFKIAHPTATKLLTIMYSSFPTSEHNLIDSLT